MKKLLKVLLHPLSLPLIWAIYLFTTFFGAVRYGYIVKSGGGERLIRTSLSVIWRSSTVFLVIFVIILGLWVWRYLKKAVSTQNKISFVIVGISSVAMLIVSNYLIRLEYANHANYLYSKYGLTLLSIELMNNISIFGSLLLVGFIFYEKRFWNGDIVSKYERTDLSRSPKKIIALSFLIILLYYSLLPFIKWENYISYLNFSYEMQFEHFEYIEELQAVPEDAKVILPVQSSKWPAISNPPVVRYFLHPRILVSSLYITDQEKANDLGEAYFIVLRDEKDGSLWPILDKEKSRITFKEDTILTYNKLSLFQTRDGMIIYNILF